MAAVAFACNTPQRAGREGNKVIVLGIDGLDPKILRRFVQAGKMPNFAALERAGSFRLLRTSVPPQSPVAWSSLITGMDPGGHGIFDFIQRDPATLQPALSISRDNPAGPLLSLGDWVIPRHGGGPALMRQGKAFWEILDENGIPATIIRMPVNFPPVRSGARSLAGMGTPDILGTYGFFSFYTNDPRFRAGRRSGGQVYEIEVRDSRASAKLFGPYNSYRKSRPQVGIDFTTVIDPARPVASITIQGTELALQEGEWSDWVRLKFVLVPWLKSVKGICKFYLKKAHPYLQLYVTPVNMDPAEPMWPLSTPGRYSSELQEKLGFFYTQGIAEDTQALSNGLFDEADFLKQASMVLDEQLGLFDLELARFSSGLLFAYFSGIDQITHMFWHALDPGAPGAGGEPAPTLPALERFFEEMDRVVGRAVSRLDGNTSLLVLSDHGFAPFHRSFNLNDWLIDNGYLALKAGTERYSADLFGSADWSRTLAYGLGLNGLYFNLKGRELHGIVEPGEDSEALADEISRKLLAIRDPAGGQAVVTRVDKSKEIYTGSNVANAPDLVIGYNLGYRAGWETVLGRFSWDALDDNREHWSGDHCIDSTHVPGVLLSNRRIALEAPALTDIAPTILSEFGIRKPPTMTGRSLLEPPP